MIFEQLETDFALRQQAHEFEKFFGGDGSRAFLFYFCFAGSADGKFQVGRLR
jgi:hypothetical protein